MKVTFNPLIITLGILGTLIWAQFALDPILIFTLLGVMTIISVLSIFMRPIFSFSIVLSFILAIGFLNIGLGWNKHQDLIGQGMNIQIQSILTIGMILAWICGCSIHHNSSELRQLKEEVNRLRKVEDKTGIITFNEFLAQAQLLFTGLIRRKEEGFLVKIYFNSEEARYKKRVMSEKLSKIILDSIRAEYDLACQLNTNSFLLFLNNTNENGTKIVLDRINQKIESDQKLSLSSIYFQTQSILDNWDATNTFILNWRKEG